MGYYTSFSGELTFSRPLTFAEIQQVGEADLLELIKDTEQETTERGLLTVETATGIRVCTDESIRGYDIASAMDTLIARLPPDVEISGVIRGEGEEAGDIRRYVPNGRRIKVLRPRLVWNDGYEERG